MLVSVVHKTAKITNQVSTVWPKISKSVVYFVYTFSPWKSNLYAPLIAHTNIPVDADIPSGDPSPVVGLFLTWLYVTVFHPLEELVILVLQQSRCSYFSLLS